LLWIFDAMRPDPLDQVKADHPVYLIGSAIGILVTLVGGGLISHAARGGQVYYNHRGDSEPGRYLSSLETLSLAVGITALGLALFGIARIWRKR
jgi:hypothetical protein